MRPAFLLPLAVLALLAETPAHAADPRAVLLDYEWVGNIDPVEFNEPSGIVYHPGRNSLFVVGDNGDLCEITTTGELVYEGSYDVREVSIDLGLLGLLLGRSEDPPVADLSSVCSATPMVHAYFGDLQAFCEPD